MRATIVLGTRAELIKTFPVLQELEDRGHEVTLVHTGQHDLEETCERFGIRRPDTVLSDQPEGSSRFNGSKLKAVQWTLGLMRDLRAAIRDSEPDAVLYHGDTMTTAMAAVTASRCSFLLKGFRTAHIEAGLRSGSIWEPFPEELSRVVSDLLSDVLFAVSGRSVDNLRLHRWIGKDVQLVGNTVVDSVERALAIGDYHGREDEYGIVTVHRHENISSPERMEKIVSILEESPMELLFPLHDNTRATMEEYGLMERLEEAVEVIDLVDYPEFLHLLRDAELVYTDGGSIQEESLIFGVPCVLLRQRTERQEGLETGIQYLSGLDVDATVEAARALLEKEVPDYTNPYGDVGVSEKIVSHLEEL